MDFWHDSVDDEDSAVSAIMRRASARGRWESARRGDREILQSLQSARPTPPAVNGSVNPATGLWVSYSVFASVGGETGTTFWLKAE